MSNSQTSLFNASKTTKVLLSIAVICDGVNPVTSIVLEKVALNGEITKLYSVIEEQLSTLEIQKRLFVFAIPLPDPVPKPLGKPGNDNEPEEVLLTKSYDSMQLRKSKYKLNIVQSSKGVGLEVGVGVTVGVAVTVGVMVGVGVTVLVGVIVGVGVGVTEGHGPKNITGPYGQAPTLVGGKEEQTL